MHLKSINELNNISVSQLEYLKEKTLDSYIENTNISLDQINIVYHIFEFDGEDSWEDHDEEALKEFIKLASNGEETHLSLNITVRDTNNTVNDKEVSLIKFSKEEN